ncbi:hypothetical protein PMAC_001515, partial [Pneumocystis sp. 'macacae']
MGLRQLLRREEGRRRRQREKGRQEYRRERATRDVRLKRRGRAEQRAQKTRVGPGGGCGEIQQRACKTRGQNQRETGRERRAQSTRGRGGAGVGAGKGEEVLGTPEGVRGAGDINWRERGGGRRLTLDSQRIKRKRADPDALSAAVLGGSARCLGGGGGG